MKLDINELPKKLNEICYFQKCNDCCKIYSYAENAGSRNEVMIIKLADFQIEKDFCIDSKTLEMVKLLYPCDIEVTSNSFIIKSQKSKYTAKLREENLFDIKIEENVNMIEVDINTLTKACDFVAKDGKKISLTGVHLESNGNVYSTDSFKMYFNGKNDFKNDGITLLPSFIKNIKDLSKKDNITLFYDKMNIIYKDNNILYISKLIDSQYPSISNIIEKINLSDKIIIDKKNLKETLEIANNVGNPKGKDVKPLVVFTNNKLEVLGDNTFEAEISFDNQDKFKIAIVKDNLDQSLKLFDDNIIFNVVSSNGMGTMLFITPENDTKQIVLLLAIRQA